MEELAGWFFMTSGNEVPLRVAKGYGDLKIDNSLIRCINNEIVTHDIDVAILDPLVTLHGVEERDNGRMDTVIRIFAATADSQNCAIELAHHTRKQLAGSSADYGVDDMRGASSVKDAVRAARMLNQMPDKDADDLGIAEHERGLYFRVDRVKGNNAPPEKAVWRKFINVELPNSDDVGVVIPYDYPGQGNSPDKLALEREADKVFLEILTRFLAEGRTVSEKSGTNYAPHVFSLETEARDAKPKINKRRLVDAMRRLFVAKRIRVEQSDRRGGRKSHVLTLV
jgi:RecA-family ATPase